MASTFSLTSSSYDGRYMKLTCTQTSNGSSANSSTINWTLETLGGNSNYYTTGATTVTINGTQVYSKGRVSHTSKTFPASKGSVSGSLTVSHNNDGSKSISVSFSTAIYTSSISSYSGTWTLDSIPRYANITTFYLSSKTETTATFTWGADASCDAIQYSINNGSWVDTAGYPTFTINGLTAGNTINVKMRAKRTDSQLWNGGTSNVSVTTYDYPHCTEAPNFIIGDELKLKVYNPLSRKFNFRIIADNGSTAGGNDYTWTDIYPFNNDDWTNFWYSSIPNATSGKYKVQIIYGGVTKEKIGGTYTVRGNETPSFNDFTYKDTNATISNILGSNQYLVKGLSSLQVQISSNNKMVAQKSANPNKYIATIDTLNKSINYSTSDITLDVGTPVNAGTKRLTVTAYDSRNISKSVYKDVIIFEYEKPVINVDVTRLNNFEAQTTLKVTGTYSRIIIDSNDKNTIKSVNYRYRETGGTWSSWTTLSVTITSGKFTCSDVILSLDNTKEFEFEVSAEDNFDSNTANGVVGVGEAIFFISSNKKTCYINGVEIMTQNSYLTGANLNEIDKTSYYYVASCENCPETNGYLFTQYLNDSYIYQRYTVYDGSKTYERVKNNGTWGKWSKLENNKYSTREQAIGTWEDGSTIYRRSFTGMLNGDDATIITYDLRADNCEIIKLYGQIGDKVNAMSIGGYVNASWYNGIWLNVSCLYIYASASLYYKPYKLTVEYIKRT